MSIRGAGHGWTRAGLGAGLLWLALGMVACSDGGPSGPGAWTGLVRSSTAPAGAVILELDGVGITEVDGVGPTHAFAHRTAGPDPVDGSETWRVVLVTAAPGSMSFRVPVEDLGAGAPRAVVISAVDGEDEPLTSIASFSVEMSR